MLYKSLLISMSVACLVFGMACTTSAQNQKSDSDIQYFSPGSCDYADLKQLLPPLTSSSASKRNNKLPAQASVNQTNIQNIDLNPVGNIGGLLDPQIMNQAMGMAQNVINDPQIAPIINNVQSMMMGEGDSLNPDTMMQQIMSGVQKLLGSSNMNLGNMGSMLKGSGLNMGSACSGMNLGNIGSLLNGSGLNLGDLGSLLGGSGLNNGNLGSMLNGAGVNPGDLGAIQNAIHDFPELEQLLQ